MVSALPPPRFGVNLMTAWKRLGGWSGPTQSFQVIGPLHEPSSSSVPKYGSRADDRRGGESALQRGDGMRDR